MLFFWYLYFSWCLICAASGESAWAWNWILDLQWHWLTVKFPAGCVKRTVPIGLGRNLLPPFLPYFLAASSGFLPASPAGILTHDTLQEACLPAEFMATESVSLGKFCLYYLKQHSDEAWEVHWKLSLAIYLEAQEPPLHVENWRACLFIA